MKKAKLKKSILVKETKPGEVLILNTSTDSILGANKDTARVIKILFDGFRTNKDGMTVEEIQKKLAAISPGFRKYKHQREGLIELLQGLKRAKFLEGRD